VYFRLPRSSSTFPVILGKSVVCSDGSGVVPWSSLRVRLAMVVSIASSAWGRGSWFPVSFVTVVISLYENSLIQIQ
jgi:hypothetical protein